MTGLFTGIIGSLIGTAIQAAVGGIPIQADTSKALDVLRLGGLPIPPANWFSPRVSDEQETQDAFDNIGQHVTGAIQALGPYMQVAKSALGDASYSRTRSIPAAQDPAYSPEFLEEQRLLLLEFEKARFRTKDKRETPREQQDHPHSRRSSIAGMNFTCPVCHESLSSSKSSYIKLATECGHIFCQSCIEGVCQTADITKMGALCPICREEVGDLRKVYF